jgi:hypothetical protein
MKNIVKFSLLVLFLTYARAVAPPNDNCIDAIEIDPTSGTIIKGDTTEATQDPEWFGFPFGYCGTTIDAPGIWYKFQNKFTAKTAVTVSTCRNGTNFDSKVSVFKGADDCGGDYGAFACIGGQDDVGTEECGVTEKYTFLVAEPMWYYIFVHGCNSCEFGATGKFEMEVTTNSSFFNVIDPESDRFAFVLGDYFGYVDIPSSSSKLNFQAVFSPDQPVKSVKVSFDDQPSHCETSAPYAIFKETKGDFHGETIQKGLHTVAATPYAQRNCRGSAGTPLVKEFVVDGCSWVHTIYDVKLDTTIFYILGIYETPSIPCNFSMEVVAQCGFEIESIRMVLRDKNGRVVHEQTEYKSPYFLFGNHRAKVYAGTISSGNYTFTPFINGIEHDTVDFNVGNAACT